MGSQASDSTPQKSEELMLDSSSLESPSGIAPESTTSVQPLGKVVIGNSSQRDDPRLSKFLASSSLKESVELWIGRPLSLSKDKPAELARKLNRDVALIDDALNRQLNEILHHPRFQQLEASWRGLKMLESTLTKENFEHDPRSSKVKIKILDISWKELEEDFSKSGFVEQSATFDKIYEKEFGIYGGEPFGLIIGDYEVDNSESPVGNTDDLFVLDNMAAIAASAFCPFITNACPRMLELDDYGQLDEIANIGLSDSLSKVRWNRLIEKEDSRFVGLCLPKILMRQPYTDRPNYVLADDRHRNFRESSNLNEFCFEEQTSENNSSKLLWGGAAFAYACVVLRSFCRTGWLNEIRGVDRGKNEGGLVDNFAEEFFESDGSHVIPKPMTNGMITDAVEKELTDLGLIPLCSVYGSSQAAFYSGVSIQKPKEYENQIANANSRLSAMLHNILCVSRFAHFLKQIGRSALGNFDAAEDIENELSNWIGTYVTSNSSATAKDKARYPLFNAEVQVKSLPHKPGVFVAIFDLQPHYEIEGINAGIRLKTEL
ncbi:MAG: type VI secretion system contractile sheath large subunit [Planctomycetaceae bacterium]|nr:type VI secretion system contractile sheath large subunit [Planctomycetaceae bacterium]MCP4773968.1 type VI secretion system contractile sheath large subunit [Planctomycetaceae bacterium]